MKIKDIVNRDIVNLTNCEHEPIHIPGSIQPHGFLMGVDCSSLEILYCSANTENYLDIGYESLLGKNVAEFFGSDESIQIQHFIKHIGENTQSVKLALNEITFYCTIHRSDDICVFEAEPIESDDSEAVDVYDQTVELLNYMNTLTSLKDLCSQIATGIRKITAYDRVMIYRFDHEYNGEVFAESCANNIEPFLGLHYPHTDIPPQARILYMRNLLRMITDIGYEPVPIYRVDSDNAGTLDLSLSTLRSTSPIHVEYLKNMGVGATLTISLMHHGRLWGLIACHHYSSKNLPPNLRRSVLLKALFLTSQIDVRISNDNYSITQKVNSALGNLNALPHQLSHEGFAEISQSAELLEVCNASGVSININGKVFKGGATPTDIEIKTIEKWLRENGQLHPFHTEEMRLFLPDFSGNCHNISGVLYYPLANGNNIIWYRKETISEVHWGGDPNKAIVKNENGLHPRKSFALWKEIVRCKSNKWLTAELLASANYAHTLEKQISMYAANIEKEKFRNLNEVLKETNAELENITWISAHDLQEPLRKIQMLSSRLMESEEVALSENISHTVNRMNMSARRMQNLLADILKYTRVQQTTDNFEQVDLNIVFKEVLDDLQDTIRGTAISITANELPSIYGIPFLLKQLFSNLLQNAIKYAAADRPCVVNITAVPFHSENSPKNAPPGIAITFADNGIGFQNQYSESIFKIFARLHNQTQYEGSGIGLALCKKIMAIHNGTINASGESDGGAQFKLIFPPDSILF